MESPKTFDSTDNYYLWRVLEARAFPDKIINSLHENTKTLTKFQELILIIRK